MHPDHYIQIMGHRFTLSTEYVGRTVQVMLTPKLAKIYVNNELIKNTFQTSATTGDVYQFMLSLRLTCGSPL